MKKNTRETVVEVVQTVASGILGHTLGAILANSTPPAANKFQFVVYRVGLFMLSYTILAKLRPVIDDVIDKTAVSIEEAIPTKEDF